MEHHFNIEIAKIVGTTAATVLHNFKFWCEKNAANRRHYHDGLYWTYNTLTALTELFPYLTLKQVRTALDKLIKHGLLVKGNYNSDVFDRSLWYAVTELAYSVYNDQVKSDNGKCPKRLTSNAEKGLRQMPETANVYKETDNKPYNKPDTTMQVATGDLFPSSDPNRKTFFRNSVVYDSALFAKKLIERDPNCEMVDLELIRRQIAEWNDIKTEKRTARGWISTAIKWIERNGKRGELVLKGGAVMAGDLEKEKMQAEYFKV